MPACPRGHESDDPDWCDVCGLALSPPPSPGPAAAPGCAACGTPLAGRFCEQCGHDSTAPEPVPGASTSWRAVVRADPAWFEEVRGRTGIGATALEFPRHAAERDHVLAGERMTIGRRSRTRGTTPDLDLADLDPAVSAAHALLLARPDGGWDLVDLGSTNGTTLDIDDGPIPPHVPVPLTDGTVVHLGAWSTITLSIIAAS